MNECPTNHAYKIKLGPLIFCVSCRKFLEVNLQDSAEAKCDMPPRIYEITERMWSDIAPWKNIPYKVIKENKWYISMIRGTEYLIMPIYRKGIPVYFSARRIGGDLGPKYYYQKGTKKAYWLSADFPSDVILIGEGVADAIYLSLLGSSIGLLGSYYDGSLDADLVGRTVYLVFDGDGAGIAASLCLASQCAKIAKEVKIVSLPLGCDPTDLPLSELRSLIFNA